MTVKLPPGPGPKPRGRVDSRRGRERSQEPLPVWRGVMARGDGRVMGLRSAHAFPDKQEETNLAVGGCAAAVPGAFRSCGKGCPW